ncbi:Uncharacterized protein Adt_21375 [Abeliophyllum distichum]|uniref:DUF4283 domain-containing protein n=1 Tax=Abeliophyllum distichum TaxID=126358 RepID=A0ABD1SZ92_9LAMI
MGKKQRESAIRKKSDLVKFFRDFDEECSGSGSKAGATSTAYKGPLLPLVEEHSAGLKGITEVDTQLSPKSHSCPTILGQNDSVSDGSSEKLQPVIEGNNVEQKSGATGLKAPWVNLFKDNRKPSQCLALEVFDNLPDEIVFDHSVEDDLEMVWGYCLVGYFAGRFPGKKALLKLCDSWNVKYEYHTHASGWLVFKFEDDTSRQKVLNGGPYFVFGRPLLLKVMPDCFEFDDEEICKMPVWVMLPGLPLNYWNPKALGMIASKIGKPLSMDNLTYTRGRLSYARILVEVDASEELVRSVTIRLSSGKSREQNVIFEHEPKFCPTCRLFGHSLDDCTMIEKSFQNSLKVPQPDEVNKEGPPAEAVSSDGQPTGQGTIVIDLSNNIEATNSLSNKDKNGTMSKTTQQSNKQGQCDALDEGEAPFILVDKSKKRLAKQKGNVQEKLLRQSSDNVGTSSSAGIGRTAARKDSRKDNPAKVASNTSSHGNSKGHSLPLSS